MLPNANPCCSPLPANSCAGGGLDSFVLPPELNLVIARGEGSRVWDVAGREYLDYHLSSGPALLGHAHPTITAAVCGAAAEGHDLLLPERAGNPAGAAAGRRDSCADVVHYTGSGTEATFYCAAHRARASPAATRS